MPRIASAACSVVAPDCSAPIWSMMAGTSRVRRPADEQRQREHDQHNGERPAHAARLQRRCGGIKDVREEQRQDDHLRRTADEQQEDRDRESDQQRHEFVRRTGRGDGRGHRAAERSVHSHVRSAPTPATFAFRNLSPRIFASRITIFTPKRGSRSMRPNRSDWKNPRIRQWVRATTVAERGVSSRSDTSPKKSPSPRTDSCTLSRPEIDGSFCRTG